MSNTSNEYQDQLKGAIDATRTALLNELSQKQADKNTTLSSREAAAHDKWAAYKLVIQTKQVRMAVTKIEELAKRAQLASGNLSIFAEGAQSDAEEATSAMAGAASSITHAVAALESLTRITHGITAITEANDRPDDVNSSARTAKRAVEISMTGIDVLKSESIAANMEAAMPLAGTIAEITSLLKDQIGTVASESFTALAAARDTVTLATASRNSTWDRYYAAVAPFEQALIHGSALSQAVHTLDIIDNNSLEAVLDNINNTAGLRATAQPLAKAEEKLYEPAIFFAVPELDVYRFRYDDSLKGGAQATKEQPHTAHISLDSSGQPIAYGSIYRIFMVRKPLAAPAADAPQTGGQEQSAPAPQAPAPLLVSLPSEPVLSAYSFSENQAPQVAVLRGGPFAVAFSLESQDQSSPLPGLEYRLFVISSKLWLRQQADEKFLANRASPPDYIVLQNSIEAGQMDAALQAITQQYYADMEVLMPSSSSQQNSQGGKPAMPPALAELGRNLAAGKGRIALAYFSPVPPRDKAGGGKTAQPKYNFGSYGDMCGDEIDLAQDTYRAAVLVADSVDFNADGAATRVLSSASPGFTAPPPENGESPSSGAAPSPLSKAAIFLS